MDGSFHGPFGRFAYGTTAQGPVPVALVPAMPAMPATLCLLCLPGYEERKDEQVFRVAAWKSSMS
jgi:hypothetical protein